MCEHITLKGKILTSVINTMSDIISHPEDADQREANKLLADKFDEFKEALELLYIIANQSGRILYAKNWPQAAKVVLGEELIGFDTKGTQDLERRAELEGEADKRRIVMLEVLDHVEERSVVDGVLQVEYVERLIKDWGRAIALKVYSPAIVDRFIAPPPVAAAPPPASQVQEPAHEDVQPVMPVQSGPPSISAKQMTASAIMKDSPPVVDPVVDEVPPPNPAPIEEPKDEFVPQSSGKKQMTFMSSKSRKDQKDTD